MLTISPLFFSGKDGGKVTTVVATPGQGPDRPQEVAYTDTKVIGNGSFGVVYQAKLCDTQEYVAIKKVLQDKRFKVSQKTRKHVVVIDLYCSSRLHSRSLGSLQNFKGAAGEFKGVLGYQIQLISSPVPKVPAMPPSYKLYLGL